MFSYNVMLEGMDDGAIGYFITFEVGASSQSQAKELALNRASKMGLTIIGVEEVEAGYRLEKLTRPKVLKTYGKSYFTDEE